MDGEPGLVGRDGFPWSRTNSGGCDFSLIAVSLAPTIFLCQDATVRFKPLVGIGLWIGSMAVMAAGSAALWAWQAKYGIAANVGVPIVPNSSCVPTDVDVAGISIWKRALRGWLFGIAVGSLPLVIPPLLMLPLRLFGAAAGGPLIGPIARFCSLILPVVWFIGGVVGSVRALRSARIEEDPAKWFHYVFWIGLTFVSAAFVKSLSP